MIPVPNENHNPRVSLTTERYLLQEMPLDEPTLFFYINEPSIITSRNQNTLEEIDRDYAKENDIHVIRHLSGGGAVYHGFGNLNFSFIISSDGDSFHDFVKITRLIIQILRELGTAGVELRG